MTYMVYMVYIYITINNNMAQVAATKRTSEMKVTLNASFSSGQMVTWVVGNNSYTGKVLGKWSNFGLVVLFDGSKSSTIINLTSDKILNSPS